MTKFKKDHRHGGAIVCGMPALLVFLLSMQGFAWGQTPIATRRQDVVDTIHGVKVFDPYRWLENGDQPEVAEWTRQQNAHTRKKLDAVPGRAALQKRLWQLHEIGQLGTPVVRGATTKGKPSKGDATDRIFYTRRDGNQNQPVLYLRALDGPIDKETILIDVNRMAPDGTLALDWWYPSEDGNLVAYGTSRNGTEESTLHVFDVRNHQNLPDEIDGTRACSLSWLPDGSGFYYTRYPRAGQVPAGQENYHRSVFFHRIGADPATDEKIFPLAEDGVRDMTDWPHVALSPNGRFLTIEVGQGWAKSELHLIDRAHPARHAITPMVTGQNAIYSLAGVTDDAIYVLSNEAAPRYRLWQVNPHKPDRKHWRKIIGQSADTLESAHVTGDLITAVYLQDASSRIRIFDRRGKPVREVSLPGLGSVQAVSGRVHDGFFFYSYQSFLTPTTVFRHDLKRVASQVWAQPDVPIDSAAFEVKQVRVPSTACATIPMFIIHKKGINPDGRNPALLYGYGGFNISVTPRFAGWAAPFLEAGGVYAVANLRGGGEYGEDWHRAGMLQNKQNVFDDFIAAAEYLIEEKWTTRDRLAIAGRSNGGLLVGAAITQRPDLFRAAISGVPLLDMVRYHKFRIAKLWIPEYGDPDRPEDFKWLYAYSPYHRIKAGTRYPATLLVTAASDTRVDAMHARKMAAHLQMATTGPHPILLRLEAQAGHGAGKPLGKLIEQYTDELAFLFHELGIKELRLTEKQ